MSVKQAPVVDERTMFYEAALLDLPAAAARRVFAGDERGFIEAGWKAYDSWVRLANETANQIYANRASGEAASRAFENRTRTAAAKRRARAGLFWNLVVRVRSSDRKQRRGAARGDDSVAPGESCARRRRPFEQGQEGRRAGASVWRR